MILKMMEETISFQCTYLDGFDEVKVSPVRVDAFGDVINCICDNRFLEAELKSKNEKTGYRHIVVRKKGDNVGSLIIADCGFYIMNDQGKTVDHYDSCRDCNPIS